MGFRNRWQRQNRGGLARLRRKDDEKFEDEEHSKVGDLFIESHDGQPRERWTSERNAERRRMGAPSASPTRGDAGAIGWGIAGSRRRNRPGILHWFLIDSDLLLLTCHFNRGEIVAWICFYWFAFIDSCFPIRPQDGSISQIMNACMHPRVDRTWSLALFHFFLLEYYTIVSNLYFF
jgi:hypothetical protein